MWLIDNVHLGNSLQSVQILIDNNKILAIGSDLELPSSVFRFDGQDSWVFPALWDEHVHVDLTAMNYSRLDLSNTKSAREIVEKVGLYCAQKIADDSLESESQDIPIIVHGGGFRAAGWPDQASVKALDKVSCGLPVILISGDAHCGWMNSAGLKLLGLPDSFTGLVAETPWFAALAKYNQLPDYQARLKYGLEKLGQHCLEKGIMGIKDMSFSDPLWLNTPAYTWENMQVELCCYPEQWETRQQMGLSTGSPIETGIPGPILRQGPLKIITDGSLGTCTAYCSHPYADGGQGVVNYNHQDLFEICEPASRAGFELALHAIGDLAIETVLSVFAETNAKGSIEHAQLIFPEQVKKMAELGLRASVQPAHLLDDYPLAKKIWPAQMEHCYPFQTLAAAGVELALGSDAPVAPLDPWLAMAASVYRGDWQNQEWEWEASQRLSAHQALAASCRLQSVAPGKFANLLLLPQNPVLGKEIAENMPASEKASRQAQHLAKMRVNATILAGKMVWQR